MKLLPIMKNACLFYCYLLSSLPLCFCTASVCCLVINLACKPSVVESVFITACVLSPDIVAALVLDRYSFVQRWWKLSVMQFSEKTLQHHKSLLLSSFKCWTACAIGRCPLVSPHVLWSIRFIVPDHPVVLPAAVPPGLIRDTSEDSKYLPLCS